METQICLLEKLRRELPIGEVLDRTRSLCPVHFYQSSVHRQKNQSKSKERSIYFQLVRTGAPVYMVAILEYLASEVLELVGNASRDNKKILIIPRHVLLDVRNDEEVTIAYGGALPK